MKLVIFVGFPIAVFFISLSSAESDNSAMKEEDMIMTNGSFSVSNVSQSDDDLEDTLVAMQNNMKRLTNNVMKQLFPFAIKVGMYSEASLQCLLDFSSIVNGIKNLDAWAFRMMDASGKLSGGLLEGTSTALGDYDECLDVKSPSRRHMRPFSGQYCLLEIKPPGSVIDALKDYQVRKDKTNHTLGDTKSFLGFLRKVRTNPDHVIFRMGICVPSSCYEEGLQSIIELATEDTDIPIEVVRCEYKEVFHLETHQILIMSIIVIILIFVILATVIHVLHTNENDPLQTPDSKCTESNEGSKKESSACSKCMTICSRFSLYHNIQKLLDCSQEGDATDVVRGMKFFTILFAIFTHTYALPHPLHLYRFRDAFNFVKFIDDILFGAVANSSVGVDTFFFLAGFDFVFNRWRLLKRPNILRYILQFLFVTYIRMLILQVLVGSLFFILPVFGSGPLWKEFVEEPLDNCRNNWWMNLLFIQNILGPYDICLYPTWMLATFMQLFLITAVLVYILHRWPAHGVLFNGMTIMASIFVVATVTAISGYPATFSVYFYDYRTTINLWKYLYTQSYTHIGPHCIGMLTAYFMTEYSSRKVYKHLVIPLWIVCLMTFLSIVFGLHGYRDGQEMDRGLAVFYAAVHRPAWAIAVGWIIYACATGHGGIMNSLLSWKALIPMERLCYLAYLLHVPLMYYQGGVQRERMFMGHYNQLMCFLAYSVVSFFLAFVCYLLFQAPYEAIEGFVFNKQHGNIWEASPVAVSQETLESPEGEKESSNEEEDKSKVFIVSNK